jgi:thioredoxin-related protein
MNKTTFKDPQVVDRLNELVAVKVNAEDGSERDGYSGRDLAARYGVSGYPTLMVLSPDGRVLARRSGYLSATEFLTWVNSTVSIL